MRIAGCQIDRLDNITSLLWLQFVLGRGGALADLGGHAWVLCHCDDGVTWGRREGDEWLLGSSYFPELCPAPTETNIQEMRVFSPAFEVLIWRTENGLRGRVLRDVPADGAQERPETPDDEERLLLAGRVAEHREGFTRVGDGSGAEQVLPLHVTEGRSSPWPRLRVRHYFAREDRTGSVRVAATRLVDVM